MGSNRSESGQSGNKKNKNEKVTLWTRQPVSSLEQIKKDGVYRTKKQYIEEYFEDIAPYFLNLYSWFTEQASKIVPKPDGVELPVWCSISEEYMLRPIEGTVVYVLEVKENEIVYFDSFKWDLVLNHLYIPKDEEDLKQYQEELKQKGFKDSFSFIEGKYAAAFPSERKRVMDSWVRIFEIDEWHPMKVQANIWEIREEQIREVIPYQPIHSGFCINT
ncbi:MAG: DUF3841 domain-containing protein [Anaerovoracaceae bacterium]|jgi:hypothetical protein